MKGRTGAAANALHRAHYIRAERKLPVWCPQGKDRLDRHFWRGAKADPVAVANNHRWSGANNRRKPRVLEEHAHNLPGTLQLIGREFAKQFIPIFRAVNNCGHVDLYWRGDEND